MGRLILRLLGTPEVSHAEQPLTFQTRKVLALLAYLAVEQGVHSRDKITALLWPESDDERGKASLRRALAYLRQSLHETSHERSGNVPLQPPHVLIKHHTLSFNLASDFEIDTQSLQAAFTLARRRSSGDLDTHLAHLHMAASCYRGNFLDGLSLPDAPDFEDWLLLQRESWHRQANTVFDRLSQWQTEAGELENALETTTRWVEHDLLNETSHTRLMQLHSALGDRAAALRAFERCRAILERELSVEPSSEIMGLAERIRSQASPVLESALHEAPSPREAWEFPFTGRTVEYHALVTAFQTMLRGRMQVATIEGEPGIGKTRLAREFLRWARAQGADVLEARAFETGSRLPYQPLVEALRSRLEGESVAMSGWLNWPGCCLNFASRSQSCPFHCLSMKQRLAPACSRQSCVLGVPWQDVRRSSSSLMMRSGRMPRRSMCCSMPADAGQPHIFLCSCFAPSVRTTWRAASRLPSG